MKRADLQRELEAWTADVTTEALKQFDEGTPAPLVLLRAQDVVYVRWLKLAMRTIDSVIPPSLQALN